MGSVCSPAQGESWFSESEKAAFGCRDDVDIFRLRDFAFMQIKARNEATCKYAAIVASVETEAEAFGGAHCQLG